jgi:hypothetical protein
MSDYKLLYFIKHVELLHNFIRFINVFWIKFVVIQC